MGFKGRSHRLATAVSLLGLASVDMDAVRVGTRTDHVDVSPLVVQAPVLNLTASFTQLDAKRKDPEDIVDEWVKDGFSDEGGKWKIQSCIGLKVEDLLETDPRKQGPQGPAEFVQAPQNQDSDGNFNAKKALRSMLANCLVDLLADKFLQHNLMYKPIFLFLRKHPDRLDIGVAVEVTCSGEKWEEGYTCPNWQMGENKVELFCVDAQGKRIDKPQKNGAHGTCKVPKAKAQGHACYVGLCPSDLACVGETKIPVRDAGGNEVGRETFLRFLGQQALASDQQLLGKCEKVKPGEHCTGPQQCDDGYQCLHSKTHAPVTLKEEPLWAFERDALEHICQAKIVAGDDKPASSGGPALVIGVLLLIVLLLAIAGGVFWYRRKADSN